jgi:hypothetical protein
MSLLLEPPEHHPQHLLRQFPARITAAHADEDDARVGERTRDPAAQLRHGKSLTRDE